MFERALWFVVGMGVFGTGLTALGAEGMAPSLEPMLLQHAWSRGVGAWSVQKLPGEEFSWNPKLRFIVISQEGRFFLKCDQSISWDFETQTIDECEVWNAHGHRVREDEAGARLIGFGFSW